MAHVVQFSEAAFIALHGMVIIAQNEESINVLQISERLKASKHHVAKVMQRLVKEGYLESRRGPLGGFKLKKETSDISLLDLYESIEGKIEIGSCPLDVPVCVFDKCIFNNVTKHMTEEFVAYMKNQTLQDFI